MGSRPGWELSRGEFSGVGTVRGGNYLGENCPGVLVQGGGGGEGVVWGVIVRGVIVRGVLVQGGVVRSPCEHHFWGYVTFFHQGNKLMSNQVLFCVSVREPSKNFF